MEFLSNGGPRGHRFLKDRQVLPHRTEFGQARGPLVVCAQQTAQGAGRRFRVAQKIRQVEVQQMHGQREHVGGHARVHILGDLVRYGIGRAIRVREPHAAHALARSRSGYQLDQAFGPCPIGHVVVVVERPFARGGALLVRALLPAEAPGQLNDNCAQLVVPGRSEHCASVMHLVYAPPHASRWPPPCWPA